MFRTFGQCPVWRNLYQFSSIVLKSNFCYSYGQDPPSPSCRDVGFHQYHDSSPWCHTLSQTLDSDISEMTLILLGCWGVGGGGIDDPEVYISEFSKVDNLRKATASRVTTYFKCKHFWWFCGNISSSGTSTPTQFFHGKRIWVLTFLKLLAFYNCQPSWIS